jgi:hypothetical protein
MRARATRIGSAIVVVLALACGPVRAEPSSIFIRGWGTSTCESWTAERKKPPPNITAAMTSWVFGFLSAYNVYAYRGPANGVDQTINNADIVDWLDRFCQEQPARTLAEASATLVKLLGKQP